MIPALPPSMVELRDQSAEEVLASLKRTPLFMTSLDDAANDGDDPRDGDPRPKENVAVEALRALAYEGSPVEVATNFREHGNECFRDRKWIDAREFYTNALSVLADDDRQRHDSKNSQRAVPERGYDGSSTEDDREKRRKLQEALLLNRAACNLELQNHRRTIADCAAAVQLFSTSPSPKAYYRTSLAFLGLSRLDEAAEALSMGLKLAPKDSAMHRLRELVKARREEEELNLRRQREQKEQALAQKRTRWTAIKTRGWICTKTSPDHANTTRSQAGSGTVTAGLGDEGEAEAVDLEDAKIFLSDPSDAESVLHVPMLILYPMASQSDFIKAVAETETLTGLLKTVLPVPWEEEDYIDDTASPDEKKKEKEYQLVDAVDGFMETITITPATHEGRREKETEKKGLIKVGKKIPLGDILRQVKVGVVDGMVKVMIVPKGKKTETFITEYMRRFRS